MISLVWALCCATAVLCATEPDEKKAVPALRVLQVTPSNGPNVDSPFLLEGSAAITVVFNRAVIALGSDWGKELTGALSPFQFVGLPSAPKGKLRWVTTSIARFDPEAEWPTDLSFSIEMRGISTFDGSALAAPVVAKFVTKPLSMRARGVTSVKASDLTNGRWSAQRGDWANTDATSAADVEVPSDAVVTIDFQQGSSCQNIYSYCPDAKIEAQRVASALVLRNAKTLASLDIKTSVKACKYGGDHCISFAPPALDANAAYQLVLPKGTVYSASAGPLPKDLVLPLFGLFPFELPFSDAMNLQRIGAHRWRMYLRHGLADDVACDSASCAPIASAIAITDSKKNNVAFTLTRVDKSTLELYAPSITQLQTYTVTVQASAAVRDGFGQPLVGGEATLTMAPATSVFTYNDARLFEKGFSADLSFVHRMQGNKVMLAGQTYCQQSVTRVSGVNIDASNIVAALTSMRGNVEFSSSVSQTLSDSTNGAAQTTVLPTAALWGKSQTFLLQSTGFTYQCTQEKISSDIVSRADLSLTLLGTLAQVTRPSDNSLVSGAKITVYSVPYNAQATVVSTSTTDANGLVELALNNAGYEQVITVAVGDELLVLRNTPQLYQYAPNYAQAFRSAITTDRNLYKEGDSVSVKGYLRSVDAMALLGGVTTTRIYGAIQWDRDDVKSTQIVSVDVSKLGSFVTTLNVPNTVSYGVLSATFYTEEPKLVTTSSGQTKGGEFGGQFGGFGGGPVRGGGAGVGGTYLQVSGQSVGSVAVNVADPRIPTGVLSVTSDDAVYKPKTKSGIALKLSTQTYTGAPLPGSEVTVAWTVTPAPRTFERGFFGGLTALYEFASSAIFRPSPIVSGGSDKLASGERVFKTDENGLLTAPLLLSSDDLAGAELKDGQTLTLAARMIGATRELLTDTLTLPIRASPWQVRVKPSSDSLVPGLRFGVSVDVVDADGKSVNGVTVAIELAEASDAEALSLGSLVDDATGALRPFANRATAQTCQALSDGGRDLQCTSLALKSLKKFLLRASATARDGSLAESALPLGKTADEWAASPVGSLPEPILLTDKQQYRVGDVVSVRFMNPFAGASRLLVRWGDAFAARSAQFSFSAEGESKFTLPALGKECRTGCTLVAALQAPRDATRSLASAPISKLFDLKAPQAMTAQVEIDVEDKSLQLGDVKVSTDAPDNVTAPRKRVQFTVDVVDAAGQPLADGEVHLFVVDRKVLDLAPHAVLRAADEFAVSTRSYQQTYQSQAQVSTFDLHQQTLVRVVRRAVSSPFTSVSWSGDADLTDAQFDARSSSGITYFSGGACQDCDQGAGVRGGITSTFAMKAGLNAPSAAGGFAGDAAAPTRESSAQSASSSLSFSAPTSAPELRTEPVWTPLSATAQVKNGKAVFVLEKMPDNLGTFRVAALATDGLAYSTGEASLVSRLEFNVEPSLPRIARVGDRFLAGATVSSNLDKARYPLTLYMVVSVTCDFIGLLDAQPSKPVVLTAPGPVRVEFGFEAFGVSPAGADVPFYFTLLDSKANQLDRLVARVPVLPQQDSVLVATSFAIEATTAGQGRSEGLVIPEHVDHSATITVQAGVGRLPAIISYADELLDAVDREQPSGLDYVAATVPTWLLSGAYAKAVPSAFARRINVAFETAVSRLASLTLSEAVGLVYYPPQYSWTQLYADVSLNAFAFWATDKLTDTDRARLPRATWQAAVGNGLHARADQARQYGATFDDFDVLVEVLYTFGFDFRVTFSPYADQFAASRLFANVDKLSSRGEALLAAALIERASTLPSDQSALVQSLLTKLTNKIRTQGRTAYIAYASGSKYADFSASFDGLLALSVSTADKLARIDQPAVLTEKLANWVAAPGSDLWYRVGGVSAVRAAYALARYDATRGNSKPNFTLRAASGGFELLHTGNGAGVAFTDVSQPPVQASTNAWLLPPVGPAASKGKLELFAKGSSGEASVVVSIDFVPCDRDRAKGPQCRVSTTPVYRGIDVQKVIRSFNPSTGESVPGAGITDAKSGEQVEVTVQITTPDDIANVQVVDWLPAGLEALAFAEAEQPITPYSWFYGWWAWSSFPVKEVRKDRVVAFAYYLTAGTHTLTYKALVVTPGKFSLPPAKAFAQGQPELLGLSAGGVWGTADPAWNSVIAGRQAGVCSYDSIKVLIDGQERTLPPANIDDKPTPSPTFTVTTSASSIALSAMVAIAVVLATIA